MGKNQITTKDTQSQGVCEKIFKAMNVSPAFPSFRRISTVYPQTLGHISATSNNFNFATKPIVATSTDHHRNDPAKATIVTQNGSTIPLELKGQQMIPLLENDQNLSFASNMVHVEYNHTSVNSKAEPLKKFPENKSPIKIKNMVNKVQLNEDYNDSSSNDRFSKYIDHVKNKLQTMSSFDDDDDKGVGRAATRSDSFSYKVPHYTDCSKLNITISDHGDQGAV